jgi:ornithine carbamoyltransferase
MHRDFLSFADLKPAEVLPILERARALKAGRKSASMAGKHAVLLFEKPSLRTKLSFWVSVEKLGGKPVYFGPEEVGLGKREPVEHVAQVVSRMADVAVVRTFAHSTLQKFAAAASVPVINALTDAEHPCQALADVLTMYEQRLAQSTLGRSGLNGAKVAYIGDGNNMAVSLAYAVVSTGGHFVIAAPHGYELPAAHARRAQAAARKTGGSVTQLRSPQEAVKGADFVYTDVWTSMGQEAETAVRKKAFAGYQVSPALMKLAGRHAKFMHDLPAHPGEEVSPGMVEHPSSIVFDQAGNRLWAQAALLDAMFSKQ